MKLKKLLAVEVASVVVVLVVVMVFVEITPYLISSNQTDQIGMYNQKEFADGNATLTRGQTASARFNYSNYDPAILVVSMRFQNWQKPGYLSVYCNGKLVSTVYATPENPRVDVEVLSLSGLDLVKPRSDIAYFQLADIYTYGNEITFSAQNEGAYEGTFSYQISIRGSR